MFRSIELVAAAGMFFAFTGAVSAAMITQGSASEVAASPSGNYLNIAGDFGTASTGNWQPDVEFQVAAGGIAVGTHTLTFDVRVNDKADDFNTSFRGSGGDGSDFEDSLPNFAIGIWTRATRQVTVTGDPWTGKFSLQFKLFDADVDGLDVFDVDIDNVSLLDGSSGQQLLKLYDFESDAASSAPADVSIRPSGSGEASSQGAVTLTVVPEPGSFALMTLGGLLALCRGTGVK